MSGVIVSVEGHATSERRSRGRDETDWSRVESRDEQNRGKDEAERERASRDETQRGRGGRDEIRAPAETKRVSKERRKAREKTRAMTAK